MPAPAQDEQEVAFTDIAPTFRPVSANGMTRMLDIRKIDGPLTPKDQFFALQHMNRPEIDPATYRLKFTGLVKNPVEFTLADLRAMRSTEVVAGYECSGNSSRSVEGLC